MNPINNLRQFEEIYYKQSNRSYTPNIQRLLDEPKSGTEYICFDAKCTHNHAIQRICPDNLFTTFFNLNLQLKSN